jgi:hypothetical protein
METLHCGRSSRPMEKVGILWCDIARHHAGTQAGRGSSRGNGDQIVWERLDLVENITGKGGNHAHAERRLACERGVPNLVAVARGN